MMKTKLLYNSCFKKKHLFFVVVISFVSMYIMLSYLNIISVTRKAISDSIIKDCGSFDYMFFSLSTDQINQIKNLKETRDNCGINYFELKDGKYNYKIYGTEKKFLELSPYMMIKGTFPENENEILCEPWLLRQKGIVSDNMIGEKLDINGKQYTVTGLCKNTSNITSSEQTATIITRSEQYNGIILNCDNDNILLNSVHNLLKSDEVDYVINDAKLSADNDQSLEDYSFFIVLFVLFISNIIILVNLITFMQFKLSDSINTLLKLGVRPYKISNCMVCVLGAGVIIANILACIVTLFTSNKLLEISSKFNDVLIEYTGYKIKFKEILPFFILASALELIIISITVIIIFKGKNFNKTGQIKKFYPLNPKKRFKNVFLSMGFNNIRIGKKVSIFTVLSISISIVSMISLTYYFSIIKESNAKCGDVKYVINFDNDLFLDEEQIAQKEKIIDEISVDPNIKAVVQNMFFTTFTVSKDSISDDFKKVLKKNSSLNAQIDNNIVKNISIPVGVISAEWLDIDNVKENVLYTVPLNLDISNGIIPKEKESIYSIYNANQEAIDIKLKNINTSPPKELYASYPFNIIILDKNEFDRLSNFQKPMMINIMNDVNENDLIYYTDNAPFCKIESLYENMTTAEKGIKSIISISKCLCSVYICVIIMNFLFSAFLRLMVFKKEYQTILLLGVDIKYLFLTVFFEVFLIIFFSLIIAFILSFIVTNLIFKFMPEEITVFLSYRFPYMNIIISYISLLIIMAIALIMFMRSVVKIKV